MNISCDDNLNTNPNFNERYLSHNTNFKLVIGRCPSGCEPNKVYGLSIHP